MSKYASTMPPTAGRDQGSSDERPGAALQRLIDAASDSAICLPAGRYVLDDSLRLRSGLTITTDGPVILTRAAIVESPLRDVVGYGHREFRPVDAKAFRVGMGVALCDRRGGGFGTTVARIIGENDGWFFLDTPAGRDFRPADGACVRSVFPIVAGYGIEHASIEGVTIEGDGGTTCLLDGCRDAGVYLLNCRDVRLSQIEVSGYPGDAISFQQCIDIYVQDCHLHHNAGHGLHPGSGSVRYVMRSNFVHDNGGCGVFYCLRTTHSLCQENRLEANAAEGISLGERDTDHLIDSNMIRNNGLAGIRFRRLVASGADRVAIRCNVLDGNGAGDGSPGVDVAGGIKQVVVENNAFAGRATVAIRIGAECEGITVAGNFAGGVDLPISSVESASPLSRASGSDLDVGPALLPADGARHLGVTRLERWVDRSAKDPLSGSAGKGGEQHQREQGRSR